MNNAYSTACPTTDAIRHYAAGGFDDDHAQQLESHVLSCPQCETMLDALDDPSDAVIQALTTLPLVDEDEADYQTLRSTALSMPVEFADEAEASSLLQRTSRLADPKLGPLPFRLGNYELHACIGRGASGAVYRAKHLKLEQMVAVKVLDESRSIAAEAFLQEMKTIGSLAHPNIVRATDAGEVDGLHFLVMEYIEGIDAARLLFRNGALPIADACEIAREAAAGLAFIHERSLIHRDIKPSNLLITADGVVKLLDLGIATAHTDASTQKKPQGTLDYMPPEQLQPVPMLSPQGDLYSLGVTLYKLIVGNSPVKPFTPASQLRADTPRAIDRLLGQLLAPSPADRPNSAAEVVDQLSPHCRSADLQKLLSKVSPSAVTSRPRESPKKRSLARRGMLTGLCTVGALGFLLPRLPFAASPRLRRTDWRPLIPESPKLLLSLGEPNSVQIANSAGKIRMTCEELTLLHLGRPVSGQFELQVKLSAAEGKNAGVFFQARSDYSGAYPTMEFQTIELASETKNNEFPMRKNLVWSKWHVEKRHEETVARQTPLAEVPVELTHPDVGQLQVTCGRQGMPEVRWNGKRLDESIWQFAFEARSIQRMSTAQLQTAYLGRLGLVNSGGSTTFVQPQLAYL